MEITNVIIETSMVMGWPKMGRKGWRILSEEHHSMEEFLTLLYL